MMMKLLTALATAVLVSSCGGGGDSAPAGPSAVQGLWLGTTTTNRAVTGLVFSDGSSYVLYSRVGNPALLGGVVQGSSSAANGTWSSGDARDFNLEGAGVLAATLAGTYTAKQSLAGTATYSNGSTTSFSGTYNAAYETVPTLSAVSGMYNGTVAFSQGSQAAQVSVAASGAVTATASGCIATGTATPRTDGNAYNVTLTYGPAPCFFAGQTFNGIAYFDAPNKRLYAAAPNAARTDGVLFIGTKP